MRKIIDLKLNVLQFRIIFIFWTFWGLTYAGLMIYMPGKLLYELYTGRIVSFKTPSFLVIQFFLGQLLLVNVLLFYVLHIDRRGSYFTTLKWIAISCLGLFLYWNYCLRNNIDAIFIGHGIFFMVLHVVVFWKQQAYFNFLRARSGSVSKD
jgi:hypothetical protein